MNAIITQYKKTVLMMIALVAINISSVLSAACSACAAAAAIRQSIKDAQAALMVGQPASREMELDSIDSADLRTIEACCEYCATTGNYCGGENSSRCRACQEGLLKVAVAAIDAAVADASRAPREALPSPCISPGGGDECLTACDVNGKLQALFNCCVNTNQQVRCQGILAEKCCRKLRHDIDDVEDLVVSQIDQSAICCSVMESLIGSQIDLSVTCCSVTDTTLGDPTSSSAIDLPTCQQLFSITDFVNSQDIDVIAWLKSLYVLLAQVYLCSCTPCD